VNIKSSGYSSSSIIKVKMTAVQFFMISNQRTVSSVYINNSVIQYSVMHYIHSYILPFYNFLFMLFNF
jgi:hypothetical protein